MSTVANYKNIEATKDTIHKLEKSITFSYDVIYDLRNNKLASDAYSQDLFSIRMLTEGLEFERQTVRLLEAKLETARLFLAECQK